MSPAIILQKIHEKSAIFTLLLRKIFTNPFLHAIIVYSIRENAGKTDIFIFLCIIYALYIFYHPHPQKSISKRNF